MKAIVKKEHWNEAEAEARTERVNRSVPAFSPPGYHAIVDHVTEAIAIDPAPSPQFLRHRASEAELTLDHEGNLKKVSLDSAHLRVINGKLKCSGWTKNREVLADLAEKLDIPFEPEN